MKKVLTGVLLALLLTGCGLKPMTKPDTRLANGYATEMLNYERINDKNIHLIFERDLDDVDARFYWQAFQKELVEKLQQQGVNISKSGVAVVVRLDKFKLLGSSHASVRTSSTGLSVFTELGGGIIGAVAGVALESRERANAKKKDDDWNLVPIIDWTVSKPDGTYNNTIKMTSVAKRGNYLASSRDVSVQAVSELFE